MVPLTSVRKKDPFNELVNIVISQFISTKAAAGIKKKMLISLNEKKFSIRSFQKLSIQEIKDLGLSTNKAKSIKELKNISRLNQLKIQFLNFLKQIERRNC